MHDEKEDDMRNIAMVSAALLFAGCNASAPDPDVETGPDVQAQAEAMSEAALNCYESHSLLHIWY